MIMVAPSLLFGKGSAGVIFGRETPFIHSPFPGMTFLLLLMDLLERGANLVGCIFCFAMITPPPPHPRVLKVNIFLVQVLMYRYIGIGIVSVNIGYLILADTCPISYETYEKLLKK